MSKVYSFRLDADNPREAQAMDVIKTWVSHGYSFRHILTEALISYGNNSGTAKEWDRVYDQLSELVQGLGNGGGENESSIAKSALSSNFIDAMKTTVKEGLLCA